jgi:hypothetical protein
MKKAISLAAALVLVLAFFTAASAEVVTKFYGYQWLRYENKVVGNSVDNKADTSQFSVPRTYLRWKITDALFEGNITLDINNVQYAQGVNVSAVTYTATTVQGSVDWAAWLKYASVDLLKIPGLEQIDAQLRVGIQKVYFGTLDVWEYPVIDKEPIDKYFGISSADFGVALVGRLPAGYGSYELAAFSGEGYKKLDLNAEKMYMASLLVTPLPGLYGRGSYMHNLTNDLLAPAKDQYATAIVLGYATGPIEGWVEYATKFSAKDSSASKSGVMNVWSSYLGIKLTNELSLAGMWMQQEPDTKKTKTSRDNRNVWQIGASYKLADTVLLQFTYELDQLKFPVNNDSNTTTVGNLNYFWTQIKWGW